MDSLSRFGVPSQPTMTQLTYSHQNLDGSTTSIRLFARFCPVSAPQTCGSVGTHFSRTVRTRCQVSFHVWYNEVASTLPSARVMRDEAGRSRGYGFVMFETPDQASAAIRATNGAFFEGKQIRVRFHEPGPIRPGETPRNQKQRSRSYYQAPSPFVGLNGLYGVPDTFASP